MATGAERAGQHGRVRICETGCCGPCIYSGGTRVAEAVRQEAARAFGDALSRLVPPGMTSTTGVEGEEAEWEASVARFAMRLPRRSL